MKKPLCLALFLLTFATMSAQRALDSLTNLLETRDLPVKEQMVVCDKLAEIYSQIDPEKCLQYARQCLRLAEKEKNKNMIARSWLNMGGASLISPSADSTLIFLNRALELSEDIGDTEVTARSLSVIAIWHSFRDNREESLDYYLRSLALYEKLGNYPEIVRLTLNISGLYAHMSQYDRQLHYLNMAQDALAKTDKEYLNLTTALNESLAGYYLRTGDYEKALEHSLLALELSRRNRLVRYEMVLTQYLAGIYGDHFKDYEKAEQYALECLAAAESIGNDEMLITAWNILAKIYVDAGRFREGAKFTEKAWEADSVTPHSAINTSYYMAVCNMYAGDREKALYYFAKRDSMMVAQSEDRLLETISDMEVRYETEKKETRIATLEAERDLYIWLGVSVFVALLLGWGFLFYRHRAAVQKQRITQQQLRQSEQEKELIAVRSALDAEKTEQEIIARDLHDGIGAMLSVVKNNMVLLKAYPVSVDAGEKYLDNAFDMLDKSIVELRRIAHHIMPAVLTEKGLVAALDDFCRSVPEMEFHFSGPDRRLDPNVELMLYRCAYELISNALRHSGATHIDVHLNIGEDAVYLSVVDNGRGFDMQNIPARGMGINNMRARIAALGGSMDIYSEEGKGTEVNIELAISGK